MKYDHIVKHNGVYYPTGADVPVEIEKTQVEIDAELKAKEEAEKLETERLESEKAEKIKSVKDMKRAELDAYAIENAIAIEDTDTVETLRIKIISEINK